MNSEQASGMEMWPSASKKRKAIAIYIDFLLFSASVTLIVWALGRLDPDLSDTQLWIQLVLFAVVEWVLLKVFSWSPGYWALGIYRSSEPGSADNLVVDPRIRVSERWWTILFGVLAVLDGTKSAIRWALWHPPIPFMGFQLPQMTSVVISVSIGCALCVVGLLVLRCYRGAALAGVALYGIALVSSILSYDLWVSWAALDVVARREYQGLPVREGEVEFMQQFVPVATMIAPALMAVWLGFIIRRFQRQVV